MSENIKKFLIIGGDERQIFLCEALKNRGYEAILYSDCDFEEEIYSSDAVILPIPLTKDGVNINFTDIPIEKVLSAIGENQIIFTSMSDKIKSDCRIFDYTMGEELAVKNAVPTAEGVIRIAIDKMKCTINKSNVLITGFGKTGKAVARSFKALGADVTIAARKKSDLIYAETLLYNAIEIGELSKNTEQFDLLVNTVPSTVVDKNVLKTLGDECVVIEIASSPYGIDFEAADNLGLNVIVAGSLPGKTAPKTAGLIICEVICNIIKEEGE